MSDITVDELIALNDSGRYAFVNYDITSLTAATAITGITFEDKDATIVATTNSTALLVKGLEAITINGLQGANGSDLVTINISAAPAIAVGDDFYVDFFSFRSDDSARANNAIYRLYLEESDDLSLIHI